jgi:hypothetical protein
MSDKIANQTQQDIEGAIPLAEALQSLRDQLERAQDLAKDKRLKFEVQTIEVEFNATLSREISAEGGIRALWEVLTAKASAKVQQKELQRLTLTLNLRDGSASKKNGKSPEILLGATEPIKKSKRRK